MKFKVSFHHAGRVLRHARKVLTGAGKVVVQPVRGAVDVVTGHRSVSDVAGDIAHSAGAELVAVAEATREINNLVVGAASGALSTLGKNEDVDRLIKNASALCTFGEEVNASALQAAGLVLEGKLDPGLILKKPLVLLTSLLAAAIRKAHDYYEPRSKPLPETVRPALAKIFAEDVLNKARYAVDRNVSITVVFAIQIVRKFRFHDEQGYGVTVGNVIVFRDEIASSALEHWGHEVQHTVQYAALGIDGFAEKYIENHDALEADATEKGQEVRAANALSAS